MKRKRLRTRDLFFVALYGVRARKGLRLLKRRASDLVKESLSADKGE